MKINRENFGRQVNNIYHCNHKSKCMKQRSEKEQQAFDMLQKLPKVRLTAVENKERWGLYHKIYLCIINDSVYLLLSGFGDYRIVTVMRKHLDEGEKVAKDMFPVRNIGKNGGPVWIASTKVVQQFEKELTALIRYSDKNVFLDQLAFASSWLERNMDGCGLNAYSMSQEEIDNAHFNYRERFRLLSEAHDEDNKRIAESLKTDNFLNMNETGGNAQHTVENEELTLQELVDRIEAMGWTVTLHRKDGATENNKPSAPIYRSSIQVPTWYNDKTYQLFSKDISNIGISNSTVRLLYSVNIRTIGQLVAMNRLDLFHIRNFGGKKRREIDDVLESLGLEYDCNLDKWHEAHKAYLASK